MVRSRLDVLVPTPAGIEIIDYKTDRVTADTIDARVETYRGQLEFYRTAVQAMTGKKVSAVHLVFLFAREIRTA